MLFGTIILVIGIALLLQAMGILTSGGWSFFWAFLFIIVGIKFLMGKNHSKCMCSFFGHKDGCCGHDHEKEN
jgi:membrane-bound ClpP family serine protease